MYKITKVPASDSPQETEKSGICKENFLCIWISYSENRPVSVLRPKRVKCQTRTNSCKKVHSDCKKRTLKRHLPWQYLKLRETDGFTCFSPLFPTVFLPLSCSFGGDLREQAFLFRKTLPRKPHILWLLEKTSIYFSVSETMIWRTSFFMVLR